ncbi:26312_t:CDS:10 [Gigaspora margarita]|uniref:26312_t:CDS:1 n=1 Tax=Gigaspora margarita TaxID=4874 RepID=A0ABN7UHB2_GIGMA|nr:26312_t:CDS:10 [Gigaspora margarita]
MINFSLDHERINDNQQDENNEEMDESIQPLIHVISKMFEQMTLAKNSTQVDVIGSIQDNDHFLEEDSDISDEDSQGWSECEDCYGNKKGLCEYCDDDVKIIEKSTLHNNSSTNDLIENRAKSTNYPIIVVEKDECFSSIQQLATHLNIQQIDEIENVPATHSNTQVIILNQLEDSKEDNVSDEDSQSLQELKMSDQPFIPEFITAIDQETGEKRQEINPEANNWNREFSKGKPAIIKNAATYVKKVWTNFIEKIKEKEPAKERGEISEKSKKIAERNSDNWLNFSSKEAILDLRYEISDSRKEILFKEIVTLPSKFCE